MAQAFNIPNILESLANDIQNGELTIHEAARELCKAGWFPYVPDDDKVKRLLKI